MKERFDKPGITVLMTVYNGERHIAEAVASILNQDFTDFELLIIDDGSTDGTASVIAQFNDPRIRVLHNGANKGVAVSRNSGLYAARGQYISILDSDDIALPNRLSLQYQFLTASPTVALCGGQAILIDGSGNQIGTFEQVPVGSEHLAMHLLFRDIFINPSCMFRRSAALQLGGYRDLGVAEDFEFYYRMSNTYVVANLPDFLIKYRIHQHNISVLRAEESRRVERMIFSDIFRQLGLYGEPRLLDVHHSLFLRTWEKFRTRDYLNLLIRLNTANKNSNKYDIDAFASYLFDQWALILSQRKSRRTVIFTYFNPAIFQWRFFRWRVFLKLLRRR